MKRMPSIPAAIIMAAVLCANMAFAGSVATVNGVAISDTQVDHAVRQSGLPDTAELRSAVKSRLIALELIHQEAAKRNLAARPEVKQAGDEARDAAAVQIYLRDAIKPNPITEGQVKARYDAIVASLGENEYKARLILVANDANVQSLLTQLKAGADFTILARQFSKAPSAAKGGELDWVSFKLPLVEGATQGYPLPIAEAIVKLPAGAVSAATIAVGNQRYIVKVDEVRPTVVPKFEAVKPSLQTVLERQELERATAQFVAGLMKNAKIQQ